MLEEARVRARERAQDEAERQADEVREELGRVAWDAVERYFPDEAKSRRRRWLLRAFLVGVAVGFALRQAMRNAGRR